ncbi:MAG: hypothetical protein IH948_08195 [Bacteroidetes bacterium]|nr:hypothetical protein [Bacteroidota bacterium]
MVFFTLIFFISVVSINAFVGIYYSKKNSIISKLVLKEETRVDDLVGKKEKIMSLTVLKEGVENSRSIGYYMEQIFNLRSPNIYINQLVIFPELGSHRADQPIVHDQNLIKIEGTYRSAKDLKLWINKLELLEDVKEVKSVSDMGKNKQKQKFLLRIMMN